MERANLLDMNLDELQQLIADLGEPKFRALQIFQWLHRGAKTTDDMSNLSKQLRERLKDVSYIGGAAVAEKAVSKLDGTAKYLLELTDGNIIESVLMQYKHGYSACISSQIGCRMGCSFCASTGIGFVRNLSAGEMIGQVLTMQTDSGSRISNIVIMGIGEPLDNYDNLIKFLRLVNDKKGLNIGYRHISVSTCGLVPQIMKLSSENMPVTLSISLHAPNDDIRGKIMPVNKRYSIDKIIGACKIYTEVTRRRITFEYALISGVNDSTAHAAELAGRLKGMLCHVNLIPVNEVTGTGFHKSKRQIIESFKDILSANGIETTVRRELGSDIEAACGQLRRSRISE